MCTSRIMRWSATPILCVVILSVQLSASTADDIPESKQVLHLSSSQDVLSHFASCALLIDRGITNSPFAGTADECILEALGDSPELRGFLGVSDDQVATNSHPEDARASKVGEEGAGTIDFLDDGYALAARDRIEGLLDDRQRTKLPVLYLNFEGLLAVRRYQFRALIGISPHEQEEIVKLARTYVDSRSAAAKAVHKRVFTLRNEELHLLPQLNLQLRQLSSELDHKIANVLTKDQRERLAAIVIQASQVTDLIQGPGVGRPWRSTLQLTY